MTKKIVCALVCAVMLGAAGLNWTSIRALWNRTNDAVNGAKSTEQLVEEVAVQLRDMDEQITRHEVQLAKVKRQAVAVERDLGELHKRRDRQLDFLRQAKLLLAAERDSYEVKGRRCSRAEVNADALVRCSEVRALNQQIESKQTVLQSMREAIKQGDAVLADARTLRGQKQAELIAVKTRLKTAEQLAVVHDLTRELRESPVGKANTALGKSWEQLRERLDEAEMRLKPAGSSGLINWESKSAPDGLKEIETVFRETASDRTVADK